MFINLSGPITELNNYRTILPRAIKSVNTTLISFYSLVLHVHGSHMCNLRHVRVVEGHVEEDRSPKDTGENEQDHCQSDQDLTYIVQATLPVLIVEHEERLNDIIPYDPKWIKEPDYRLPEHLH